MFHNAKEVNNYLIKIKHGDVSQIEPLFDITAMHLLCVAKFYLANKSLANDVVSDAFIKVLSYIDTYDTAQDGYNWLCKITQNLAYDYNKKEAKVACSEQQFVQKVEDVDFNHAFDDLDFRMLIDGLDETDQYIAYKRFVECRTFQDIGQELDLSKTAIYLRVKKICKLIEKNSKQK